MQDNVINFSNCVPGHKHYLGAETKLSLIYEGKRYMVKFPKNLKMKRNELNSDYANNVFSEYIGCHIFQALGIPSQNTVIGTYEVESGNVKIVVGCEDFTTEQYRLHEFQGFQNSFLDSEAVGRTPMLEDLENLFLNHKGLVIRKEAQERYWDTFVVDALIGNFDRHSSNWGYLVDEDTGDMKLAPVYDCGSSLYPGVSDNSIPKILASPEEIQKRIFDYPKAALRIGEDKVGYYQFLVENNHPQCEEAMKRIIPRVDMIKIKYIVENTPLLSDIRKKFLILMLERRYDQILRIAYKRIINKTYDKEVSKKEKIR